jgi:hypothetical protein
MRRLLPVIFLAALATCLVHSAGARAAFGELAFVEPEKVSVTYSGERSGEVSVWLENGGDQAVTPEFTTVLSDSNGKSIYSNVEAIDPEGKAGPPMALPAGEVARYRLVLVQPSKSSGELVAHAAGIAPAAVPLTVGPTLASTRGINGALLIPLAIAVVWLLVALAYLFFKAARTDQEVSLTGNLRGTAELDFSKSFASTLTAVGALLGTIIAAGVLPEETVKLSRGGFVGLNLTFGVAIVVAAAVAACFFKIEKMKNAEEKMEWKAEGYIWTFLLSALITLWAVCGELYAVWLLIGELGSGEGFTPLGVTMLRVLLVGCALALLPYTVNRVRIAVLAPPTDASEQLASASVKLL